MKFGKYLFDKFIEIVFVLFGYIIILMMLFAFKVPSEAIIGITIVFAIICIAVILTGYLKRIRFYNHLINNVDKLDKKYLVLEMLNKPSFYDGEILYEVLYDINKSMNENVKKYEISLTDFKEYIELWIHEIKLPIAASKMIIENNKNKATKSIEEEIDKIENYTEQALFYARSNTVEKDYIISKASLQEIVNSVIIKNKSLLISNKININLHDLEKEVYIDSKWVIFILSQIIQNAIKYSKKEDKMIEIYS